MELVVLGVSLPDAPVALREEAATAVERPLAPGLAEEWALLSTCARTELYCVLRDPAAAAGRLREWMGGGLLRQGRAAVRHAFRVASGLDSAVLGEPQVLGQMKAAAARARAAGSLGPRLERLFQHAFAAAKEVRSATGIAAATISMPAAAVELAQRVHPRLEAAQVLLVGAGEMIRHAAAHFAARRPARLALANRSAEPARRLAGRHGAEALPLGALPECIGGFDVVVCATASPAALIDAPTLERAARAAPQAIIDLGMPRNVAPAAARVPGVSLFDLDDVAQIVRRGRAAREAAAAQGEARLAARVERYMRWLGARDALPLFGALEQHAHRLCAAELARARRALARGEPASAVIVALAAGLSQKFLHAPRAALAAGTLEPGAAHGLVERWTGRRAVPQ